MPLLAHTCRANQLYTSTPSWRTQSLTGRVKSLAEILPVTRNHGHRCEYCTIFKACHSTTSENGSKPWERSAKLVKNISVNNQYLEHIRESHDPSLQLKTIEDELKGTIGKALGKAGEKVNRAVQCMHEQKYLYHQCLQKYQESGNDNDSMKQEEITTIVSRYNEYRKQAIQARWELTVHRQAIGFTVNNQKTVAEIFHIEGPLIIPGDSEDATREKAQVSKFSDQLDWWQRIGRWR